MELASTNTTKGVAERGSQTKGRRGGSGQRPKKKKSDLPFWWWNWPLPQQKWSVAWLRMVLLEFKICISCCSYFLSHTRGREAILDSSPSPKLTKWEYAKEITVMNFTRTQVTDTNQGCRNKNQFTADSKLHCEACDTDVHVGTSRTSNLNTHRDSITCKENKAANALPPQKKDKSLLSFFSRKTIQLGRSQVHLTCWHNLRDIIVTMVTKEQWAIISHCSTLFYVKYVHTVARTIL